MVDFNLDGFKSKYRNFARSYLFECKINGFATVNHEYLVKSTKLPEQTFEEIVADLQGNDFKIAGNTKIADFTIDFIVDQKAVLRKDFLKWSKDIHNTETNAHGEPSSSGYFKDITLKHIEKIIKKTSKGVPSITYELIGAWPKTIGEVNLDYSSKEFATFSVTFAYQYHITS